MIGHSARLDCDSHFHGSTAHLARVELCFVDNLRIHRIARSKAFQRCNEQLARFGDLQRFGCNRAGQRVDNVCDARVPAGISIYRLGLDGNMRLGLSLTSSNNHVLPDQNQQRANRSNSGNERRCIGGVCPSHGGERLQHASA